MVMETAWSTMWNVTDETPVNCQRFLDGGGMKLFLDCKEEFPSHESLLRNMMGLLGNVAEVQRLRSKLMSTPFVTEFAQLLTSRLDGIEVRKENSRYERGEPRRACQILPPLPILFISDQ